MTVEWQTTTATPRMVTFSLVPPSDRGSTYRRAIGALTLFAIVISVAGFLASMVTVAMWASAAIVVGLGLFCIAGLLARLQAWPLAARIDRAAKWQML